MSLRAKALEWREEHSQPLPCVWEVHAWHARIYAVHAVHACAFSVGGWMHLRGGVGEAKWFVVLTCAIAFKGTRCEDLDLMGELPDSPSFDEVLSMFSTT